MASMYQNCCMFSTGYCGPFTRHNKDGMVKASDLNLSIKEHLEDIHLLKFGRQTSLIERQLVENRMGRALNDTDELCAYHWYTLGIWWRPKSRCMHPNHIQEYGNKKSSTRTAPISIIDALNEHHGISIPYGAKFCFKHLKEAPAIRSELASEPDTLSFQQFMDTEYEPK